FRPAQGGVGLKTSCVSLAETKSPLPNRWRGASDSPARKVSRATAARLLGGATPPIAVPLMTSSGVRHVTSINDLTNREIERVFEVADGYLDSLGDPRHKHRIAESTDRARGRILASLFYEPSTRTRLSFESAMLRL